MNREKCENCKHFVVLKKGEGLCCCCMMFAIHVLSVDWCESYEEEDRKEQK